MVTFSPINQLKDLYMDRIVYPDKPLHEVFSHHANFHEFIF